MMCLFVYRGNRTVVFGSGTLLETSQSAAEDKTSPEKPKQKKNRCFTCRKKIGLTGETLTMGTAVCSPSSLQTDRLPELRGLAWLSAWGYPSKKCFGSASCADGKGTDCSSPCQPLNSGLQNCMEQCLSGYFCSLAEAVCGNTGSVHCRSNCSPIQGSGKALALLT